MAIIDWKNKDEVKKYRREWRVKNRDRLNKISRERLMIPGNREKARRSWDIASFGGNRQEVLERDNFQCQECGTTQEQHILLFNRKLEIHHIDFKGRNEKNPDSSLENLITLCIRCHTKIHREKEMIERWGDLMEQDDSEWAFPKLRELVEREIKNGSRVQEAKRIVARETGLGFGTIDHRYYELKSNTRSAIQKRRISKHRSKK